MKSSDMTPKQSSKFEKLLSKHMNSEGKILPTPEAFDYVAALYGDRAKDEAYRLAQAQTLIDLFQQAMGTPRPHSG